MCGAHSAYPRAMRNIIVVLSIVVVTVIGCGSDEPVTAPVDSAPDQVTGVVIEVESVAIDDIQSFTLKDGDVLYDIYIADDVDYGFPLGHLQEHVQSADPVAVDLESRADRLYALTIEDV